MQSTKQADCQLISIHAPTRGATAAKDESLVVWDISIHAPTRGATLRRAIDSSPVYISIHAPTRGATLCVLWLRGMRLFQSTLPRGERPFEPPTHQCKRRFQSTLPRGERHAFHDAISLMYSISIHAPTRGATLMFSCCRQAARFQSTLPRGERRLFPNS